MLGKLEKFGHKGIFAHNFENERLENSRKGLNMVNYQRFARVHLFQSMCTQVQLFQIERTGVSFNKVPPRNIYSKPVLHLKVNFALS